VQSTLITIQNSQSFLTNLEDVVGNQHIVSDEVLSKAYHFSRAIVDFLTVCLSHLRRNYSRQLLAIADPDSKIRTSMGNVETAAQLLKADLQQDEYISKLLRRRKERYEAMVKDFQSTAETAHKDRTSVQMTGAKGWILEDENFVNWLEKTTGALWCKGIRKSTYVSDQRAY
jgi:hypothetical protein